jgi:tetratricopeptide (TPR) repeat protein
MKTVARIGIVAASALSLFLVGGLGLFLGEDARPGSRTGSRVEADALLGSVGIGSLDGTIASMQERVRDVPGDWRASAALGLAYVQQSRITADPTYYSKAETLLQDSLDRHPENPDALLGLAALAAARHDFRESLRYGREARALNPFDSNVHGVVGDALVELGRYDRAFVAFQRMVDTRPDTASFARVSYARELRGDLHGAMEAMRVASGYAGTPSDEAWTSYQLGELSLTAGRLDAAARAFRDGAQLDPTSIQSFAGMAKVAWARGDLDTAIRRMEEVVRRFPTPEYVVALGDLHALAGETDAASRNYELARLESQLFRADGVNTDLELALFHADHGDPMEALAAAEAEWSRRRSIHVADALAWALHVNGRHEEAARISRRSLALGTREGLFLYHAGMIEFSLGAHEAARGFLRRALEVDPWFSISGTPEARRVLARLDGGA